MHESVTRMWESFIASGSPEAGTAVEAGYTSWQFGIGDEMAEELVALVLAGVKRATAGALWSYEAEGEALPQVGDFSIVTGAGGEARCIIRTTSVEVVPFSAVTPEFAATEGEGDGSLRYWREGHWRYFTLELEGIGRKPQEDMPVVCERFELVWPRR